MPFTPFSVRSSPTHPFDIAVIGGGVVGCAVVRRFTLAGYRCVLVEKAADLLSGASKGNSALLHTGFDAQPESVELACMRAGYAEFLEIRERMNLPVLRTGAMVAAWNESELDALAGIVKQAHANGVSDVHEVDSAAVRRLEPALRSAMGAVLVPGEHVIDPWSTPLAYVTHAVLHGASLTFNCEVMAGDFDGRCWALRTTGAPIHASQVINCAGLYGDVIESRLMGSSTFTIKPRKGQFVVFDKPASKLMSHILLPVPNERTKGVVITRTIFGNLLVGPTAEEQADRAHATVTNDMLTALIDQAQARIPALTGMQVNAVYAGLRPASEKKEYRIRHSPQSNYLALGGIRSTGLTSALGLAQHALAAIEESSREQRGERASATKDQNEPWPTMPNLAEHLPRDWSTPAHGDIVCHCEMVTRREIKAAMSSLVPAGDMGGLKRRTRACMGRCQGFYCGAKVAEITDGRFSEEPLEVHR